MSLASKAFAITGIGLIITGLALVITYWEDVSKAIGLSTDEQDKYVAKQKRMNEQSKEMRENVSKESASFATLIAQLKATNSGSKEREDLIKKINKEYGTTLKNIKDERDFQSQLNTELASYLEYQKAKYLLQRNEEKIQKNLDVQMKLEAEIAKGKKEQIALEKELAKAQDDANKGKLTKGSGGISGVGQMNTDLSKAKEKLDENKKALKENEEALKNAQLRFEDYGRAANEASAKVDELTNSGSKYVENNKEVKTSTIDTNKDLAKTLEDLTEKNKQYGLSEKELLLLSKLKTDALIQEQFLKSTDKDKEKQRTDALLANETDYNNQLNALNEKNRKTKEEKDKEANQKRIELEDKQFEVMQAVGQTEKEKEIADLVKSYEDKFAIIGDNAILEKELTEQQKKDLAVIEEKYRKQKEEKDKETADKEIERQNTLQQTKLKLAADAFTAIGGLIESFNARDEATARKQFKVAKAFNLAAALTNTYLAVTSALAMSKELFPGQRFVEAGIAGTTGLAQVAKIASTQFGGGGGGGNPDVPNPSSIIAPNLNVVGDTGINQLATLQQQPVKAYVVSNDITSAQQFDLKVQQTSQL
jgi:hypothetical protein